MNTKLKTFSTIMLAALTLSLTFAAGQDVKPVAAQSVCDAAQFIADVTVPDGTGFSGGATFVKTWRLKNVGTCTWTTAYHLVHAAGPLLGAQPSVPFPQSVAPGQTVDLSVTMTAPSATGTFTSFWMLQNASGHVFGIGTGFSHTFWVQITTVSSQQEITAFDFVQNVCSAEWFNTTTQVPCTFNANRVDFGYVEVLNNPNLENGLPAGAPSLLTVPQNRWNGIFQGNYRIASSLPDILPGDHFKATVACLFQAFDCRVTFDLEIISGNQMMTIWSARKMYNGTLMPVDIDLSRFSHAPLTGFMLRVQAFGQATGDFPVWVAPRIVRFLAQPPPVGSSATSTPITPMPFPIPATATPLPQRPQPVELVQIGRNSYPM